MAPNNSPLTWLILALFLPGLVLSGSFIPAKRFFWQVTPTVARQAIDIVGGVCRTAGFFSCLVAAIATVTLVVLSGFQSGRRGGNGAPLDHPRSLGIMHHFTNGTAAVGFHTNELEVGIDHKVVVGGYWEAAATRLETGHVRISTKIDQPANTLVGRAAVWARKTLISSRTDDNPGDTGYIDVFYYDVNLDGKGTDGVDHSKFSQEVGKAVADTIVNQQAETVCADMWDADYNSEQIASEWYIRANDGTTGTLPSGACDHAQ